MRQRLGWLVGIMLLVAVPASAPNGSVAGAVADAPGGVAPGATVTLTGPDGRHSVTTSASGEYRFAGVAAGTYEISVLMPGFAPANRPNIVVTNAQVTVPQIGLGL